MQSAQILKIICVTATLLFLVWVGMPCETFTLTDVVEVSSLVSSSRQTLTFKLESYDPVFLFTPSLQNQIPAGFERGARVQVEVCCFRKGSSSPVYLSSLRVFERAAASVPPS